MVIAISFFVICACGGLKEGPFQSLTELTMVVGIILYWSLFAISRTNVRYELRIVGDDLYKNIGP